MVVLNDFVLFLKQESGWKSEGSRLQRLEGFSEVLHARSKIKNILNSILYYPASRNINSFLPSFSFICLYFPVSRFAPGGHLLRLIHMRVQHVAVYRYDTTSDQWSYFHKKHNISCYYFDFKTHTV